MSFERWQTSGTGIMPWTGAGRQDPQDQSTGDSLARIEYELAVAELAERAERDGSLKGWRV